MPTIHRRDALRTIGAAGAGFLFQQAPGGVDRPVTIGGQPVEVGVSAVTPRTVRITVAPTGRRTWPDEGSIARALPDRPLATIVALDRDRTVKAGDATVTVSASPLTIRVDDPSGRIVQRLALDDATGALTFLLGDGPVLGMGEGGPQFDRRGSTDRMRSGQGGYQLRTHGGRVPIAWLIGTSGWAMYIRQPFGAFDLTGVEGRFVPAETPGPLPLDVFIVSSKDPVEVMAEWAALTGLPQMPPRWTLGYQQSHRTLASREEIVGVARTFREKKLPCDALIYLGTGFTPSGWNTANGSFAFNRRVFPEPKAVIDELHALHFRVVLHSVILSDALRGRASDRCDLARYDEEEAGCYWNAHRRTFSLGVDGWWPDEGDPLDAASRLVRNRMYWEGPQIDRPDERPYALHRNGHAGMQRYGAFLWSGDPYSTWETLRTHVAVGINTSLTGIPYWGTDVGGFVPTREFTGELYVRWFQFGAFCPLFRSHGRTWKLRLPWGWNTGSLEPSEVSTYGDAANPDVSELHNAEVEPICRKYLELRYRLLPYLYSAAHEAHLTGLPIMRALWLHYPDEAAAVARGDEYLWGRDILVAPVTERGATSRRVYVPRGAWYDFWKGEKIEGGRELERTVDLETMPLYVRAGALIPMDPVRQHTDEQVDGPLTVSVYPGADGRFTLYEDDGRSFAYRKGDWMGLSLTWTDTTRTLTINLVTGSKLRRPRALEVRVVGSDIVKPATFEGHPLTIQC